MIGFREFSAFARRHGATEEPMMPSHEGPHEDDPFEPTFFVDAGGNTVGMYAPQSVCVLFLDSDEYHTWQYTGDEGRTLQILQYEGGPLQNMDDGG